MELMVSKDFLDQNIVFLKEKLDKLDKKLTLVIINTIQSIESDMYINSKKRLANELGINVIVKNYDNFSTDEIVKDINIMNNDMEITGIIVQLPLADNLDEDIILDSISPLKDVDCLTSYNMGKLIKNKNSVISATAMGIIDLLDYYKIKLEGKDIVVIGKSLIVGKPISNLLINRGATVTVCHSKTRNIDFYTKNADIIIVAVGKANFLTNEMIKKGVIIVDVGINKLNGKICGDVNFDLVKNKASYITPVPGGIGAMTVYELMRNLYELDCINRNM